jgi:OFA family oxalate/formate antiporter-like MFS transporter
MKGNDRIILLAAMLVTFVTGSIHCFSVFLVPFEELLNRPRADISLFYSFALIFLTVSVLFGHHVYHRIKPATMITLSCAGAGAGLILSGFSTSWWLGFLGYSVLFGVSNGFAYGYVLQLVGRALPEKKGFAMAAVTAAYAVGSVIFSLILARVIEASSLAVALTIMGVIIGLCGLLSATVMAKTGVSYSVELKTDATQAITAPIGLIVLLWLSYGTAVLAGLMAIGHAAGIVQSLGGEYHLASWGAVFIGIGSSIGGFFIGWFISALNMNKWLLALPLISAISIALLIFTDSPTSAILLLTVVGFSYGAVISVYPFTISEYFGVSLGPKVYGLVFTAWGFAGLVGPWTAGQLFDSSGQYFTALLMASLLGLASTMIYFYTSRLLISEPSLGVTIK